MPVILVLIGIAAVAISAFQVLGATMPRTFTAQQQRQIMAWEVAARWRQLPAGTIFPASATYAPPISLQDTGSVTLTANRVGIARQASCRQAADAAAAAILDRHGCQAVLRATYVDGTGSYLVTVGVAAFPDASQASSTVQQLSSPQLSQAGQYNVLSPGVLTASFPGTAAAGFQDSGRQISDSVNEGPYVVLYTIGYADGRPKVPVDADTYVYSEMGALGMGMASSIAGKLTAQPPVPHCPGAPGC